MKKVKALLIGAGSRGAEAYAPFALEFPEKLQFVAVAEPIKSKRTKFADLHKIKEENVFESYHQLLNAQIEADVVFICTQDKMHLEPCIMSLEKGYNVLLEKPISPSEDECIKIAKSAEKSQKNLTICHVLRYTPFFKKIKELLENGAIGELISITHNENVGYYHAAHSYVRGNWRKESESSPMILAKSCHDIDILLWLCDSSCKKVSSFGSLKHFIKEKAPKGATKRCTDGCSIIDTCPYNALRIYMDENNTGWPVSVITEDFSKEGRLNALKTGPYGRCVYYCDNDVVDHQAVIMEFDNGVTASFHMNSFTYDISRTIKICGTTGEIIAKMEDNDIKLYDFTTNKCKTIELNDVEINSYGHGGGDFGLMSSLVNFLTDPNAKKMSSNAADSIESHLICFAAEKSRNENTVINMEDYKLKRLKQI